MGTAAASLRHRAGRRLRRLLGRPSPYPIVASPDYSFSLPSTPLDPLRAEKIVVFLEREGLVRTEDLVAPRPASLKQLLRVHDEEYLEALPRAGTLVPALGFQLAPRQGRKALAVQRLMTGGTLAATQRALAGRTIAINLGGGFHHAHAGRGAGFCIFNDVAVAIREARLGGFAGAIAVVDLDLHDGDGTRRIFADDSSIHTYSLHSRHWDDPEAKEATALELGSGVDDATLLATLAETLPPMLDRFRPQLVFYLAGTDPAADDPIGDWQLSAAGMLRRDRAVLAAVRERARCAPVVIVLAGGYGKDSWRYTARLLSDLVHGRPIEPPSSEEVLLARYQARARLSTSGELSGTPEDDWGLTEEDLLAPAAAAPPRRFLGFYTEQGLELALERNGLLDRLRDLGYQHPAMEIDLDHPAGHTLRLWGEPEHRHLLVETRLRRDRRLVPDYEVLVVEWLLMQNPRGSFPPGRQPLPGQRHPGIGLSEDAVAMLILICRRLGLDGLALVPSHYHLAAQSARFLRFLSPRDGGFFHALARALEGRPLAEATRLVEAGGVLDEATGQPVAWPPMTMVLPVGGELEARFDAAYRQEAEAAAATRRFRVATAAGL